MKKKLIFAFTILLFISVNAQQIELDKRALNYYSKEQITKIPDTKIKQINFLYQESFIIPKEFEGQINPNDIDIRDYSQQRLPNEQAKVFLINKDATKEKESQSNYYIYLISIEELQEAYKTIK